MITWKPTQWHSILLRLARSRRLTEAEKDACAKAVDKCSTLASTVDELRDFVDSLVEAAGAPDGESLLTRIGELRVTAAERDRLLEVLSMPELDSIVLPEEPGELYPDPVVVGLSFAQRPTAERIERLKRKITLMRKRADAFR